MKWFGGSSPAAAMATRLPARPTARSRPSIPALELQFPECKAPSLFVRETHLLDGYLVRGFQLERGYIWATTEEDSIEYVKLVGQKAKHTSGGGLGTNSSLWWPAGHLKRILQEYAKPGDGY